MTVTTTRYEDPRISQPPYDGEETLVEWDSMDWAVAVQNLALSDNEDVRRESATRVYVDIGPEELGLDEKEWVYTFMTYHWDGEETLDEAKLIFGGQK